MNEGVRGINNSLRHVKLGPLVLKNFENHKAQSSGASGTFKYHLIDLPLTKIMNET